MAQKTIVGTLVLASALATPALAQQTIDARRNAAPDGRVIIDNQAGTIHVIGWDKAEVAVSGTLGRGAEGLSLTGGPTRTEIEVEVEGNPHGVRSDLEIRVPKASRLEIDSFSANITVQDVTGTVQAESVNGSISVSGSPQEVQAETVAGRVEVLGPARRVQAESVNGSVTLKGVTGEVEASTVNGNLEVEAGALERGRFETVSGDFVFRGDLTGKGWVEAESVSGSLEMVLPAGVNADFSLSSFSGDIVNDLSSATPRRTSKFTSESDLEFTLGSGGTKVSLKTLSGEIRLRKR